MTDDLMAQARSTFERSDEFWTRVGLVFPECLLVLSQLCDLVDEQRRRIEGLEKVAEAAELFAVTCDYNALTALDAALAAFSEGETGATG